MAGDDDQYDHSAMMSYYRQRARYLEAALCLIAQGAIETDPQFAAQRALDAVGDDRFADGNESCEPS